MTPLVLVGAVFGGCAADDAGEDTGAGTEETSTSAPDASTSTGPAGEAGATVLSHDEVIQPIWTASCALVGCHNGGYPPDLNPGAAYDAIVNARSGGLPPFVLVTPGDVLGSYLYLKVTAGEGIVGTIMPPTGALSTAELALIERWIVEGAAP